MRDMIFPPPNRPWNRSLLWVAVVILPALLASCGDPAKKAEAQLADYAYPPDVAHLCAAGEKPGAAGASHEEKSGELVYSVRTPKNYDPTVAHPLLVVYPYAGGDRFATESFTNFTNAATSAGLIVVYPDSIPMRLENLPKYAQVPEAVAAKWCIDKKRVFFSGHSDGGTITIALNVAFEETRGFATAIAPSAAGFSTEDLEGFSCAAPMPVMILHNWGDRLFPEFGKQSSAWWAKCNACATDQEPKRLENGCVAYQGCSGGVETLYCEGKGGHLAWASLEKDIVAFFLRATAKP
jgi:polyhydroxybutyrate depolymerase